MSPSSLNDVVKLGRPRRSHSSDLIWRPSFSVYGRRCPFLFLWGAEETEIKQLWSISWKTSCVALKRKILSKYLNKSCSQLGTSASPEEGWEGSAREVRFLLGGEEFWCFGEWRKRMSGSSKLTYLTSWNWKVKISHSKAVMSVISSAICMNKKLSDENIFCHDFYILSSCLILSFWKIIFWTIWDINL